MNEKQSLIKKIDEIRGEISALIESLPDAPETTAQERLQKKHGTPRVFAKAVVNAIGEITYTEAVNAIQKYNKEWKDAGNILTDNHKPQIEMTIQLNELAKEIHRNNHRWWHDADGKRLERNKGELLCLIHSEISEAMEGERKDMMDDKLPHRKMAEVELADALIRILDYSAGFGYDIEGAVREKLAYNATREDHTHEARAGSNGKKW